MRYFNKITMTECILGVHEIDNSNVITLPDDHWFFTSEMPVGQQLSINDDDELILVDNE
jgi:hypothetical protein